MAFHIKNERTDVLARKLAALKQVGLTEAVHRALENELERETGKPPLVETGVTFTRTLRKRARDGRPANKAFRDSLYERD
ncbi:type II toxin-antitoxin system VapB family antitoxin [Aquamicrobium sp. LC103]|uniref:type II toxin-antitoxin system VapB family antitoxin n=1 Tax=Aquamicrobium sp. LC103 TaxID=1120658 RepID=UPI00063EB05C|nr:type II toxin-antitoxin system VapB family antitoxin [Aquamicrobium sp. LC103]TKT81413.1 transcription factor [Aquamicrobium sp. LC103]